MLISRFHIQLNLRSEILQSGTKSKSLKIVQVISAYIISTHAIIFLLNILRRCPMKADQLVEKMFSHTNFRSGLWKIRLHYKALLAHRNLLLLIFHHLHLLHRLFKPQSTVSSYHWLLHLPVLTSSISCRFIISTSLFVRGLKALVSSYRWLLLSPVLILLCLAGSSSWVEGIEKVCSIVDCSSHRRWLPTISCRFIMMVGRRTPTLHWLLFGASLELQCRRGRAGALPRLWSLLLE